MGTACCACFLGMIIFSCIRQPHASLYTHELLSLHRLRNSDNPIIDSIADKGVQDQHNLISDGLVAGFLWPSERTSCASIADDYEFDEKSGVVPDDLRARAGLSKPEPLRGPLCVWV